MGRYKAKVGTDEALYVIGADHLIKHIEDYIAKQVEIRDPKKIVTVRVTHQRVNDTTLKTLMKFATRSFFLKKQIKYFSVVSGASNVYQQLEELHRQTREQEGGSSLDMSKGFKVGECKLDDFIEKWKTLPANTEEWKTQDGN